MTKTNLKFKDFLTLLSPIQHIKVQDEDNPLKQDESETLFDGIVVKARWEDSLKEREVKLIHAESDKITGTVLIIRLYK